MKLIDKIILVLLVCGLVGLFFQPNTVNAFEENTIIGCINTKTLKTIAPTDQGNCYHGQNYQNIIRPADYQIAKWQEVYGTGGLGTRKILNRLAIVNFESGFNPYAENYWAKGYVQTLKKWNIPIDIISQLTRLKNREENGLPSQCYRYFEKDNIKDGYKVGEKAVVACLYRYHYHAYKGFWYSRKLMVARSVYINYYNESKPF